MPVDRAIVCGGAGEAGLPFGADCPVRLALDGPEANVHLQVDDLRLPIVKPLSPVVFASSRLPRMCTPGTRRPPGETTG